SRHDALPSSDLSENVDLDALTDDFHQIAGGSWDFQHIDQELFWDTVKKHNNAYLAVVKHWRPLIRGRFFIPVSGSMRIGVLERNDDNTVWRSEERRVGKEGRSQWSA